MDARRALFEGLIDHAPMFPPAELALDEALADHAAARASDESWVVNRFVVRASDLAELPRDDPPRLSVVLDEPNGLDDSRIEAFELPPGAFVMRFGKPKREVYAEGASLAELAERGDGAKVRCGGKRIPSAPELAAFIRECRRLQVPFKATAGLHHAVHTGEQHGFLNLLAAATFGDEEEALAETDAAAFDVGAAAFRWRDRSATPEEIATMRRELFVSFGSCSFTEPVDELRALGFL